MRKIIFDFFVNPRQLGVDKEINLNQLFETCMVPACPGWERWNASSYGPPALAMQGPRVVLLCLSQQRIRNNGT
jgi:hypothetical protein